MIAATSRQLVEQIVGGAWSTCLRHALIIDTSDERRRAGRRGHFGRGGPLFPASMVDLTLCDAVRRRAGSEARQQGSKFESCCFAQRYRDGFG